jgi:hypothetical protein
MPYKLRRYLICDGGVVLAITPGVLCPCSLLVAGARPGHASIAPPITKMLVGALADERQSSCPLDTPTRPSPPASWRARRRARGALPWTTLRATNTLRQQILKSRMKRRPAGPSRGWLDVHGTAGRMCVEWMAGCRAMRRQLQAAVHNLRKLHRDSLR